MHRNLPFLDLKAIFWGGGTAFYPDPSPRVGPKGTTHLTFIFSTTPLTPSDERHPPNNLHFPSNGLLQPQFGAAPGESL